MKKTRIIILCVLVLMVIVYLSNTLNSPVREYSVAAQPTSEQTFKSSPSGTQTIENIIAAFEADLKNRYSDRWTLDRNESGGQILVRIMVDDESYRAYSSSILDDGNVTDWYAFADDISQFVWRWQSELDAAGYTDMILVSVCRTVSDGTNMVLARFAAGDLIYDYFENLIAQNNPSGPSAASTQTLGQQNALRSAQSYLSISAFSRSGLIEQLEYEGYTHEEAAFAADSCGANWNEQAAKSAASYLSISSFSRSQLIEQLEFDGFTHDQALYGVSEVGY